MDKVSQASLEWSIEHHYKAGDTDIFPKRQEYVALYRSKAHVAETLAEVDVAGYSTHDRVNVAVPKPDGTFRISSYLHPLDSVVLLAALHEVASTIENGRIAREEKSVFAYRLSAQGWFTESLWDEFIARSAELAAAHSYILCLDIADFYNQVSVHRIQNTLEAMGCSELRSKSLHDFLINLNHKNSQGIPVGPESSKILSEVVLHDADTWLRSEKVPFTRFSDDYRFFFDTYEHASLFLQDFSKFLYSIHRLPVQSSKTRIYRRETFLEAFQEDPKRTERLSKAEKLSTIFESLIESLGDEEWEYEEVEDLDPPPYHSSVQIVRYLSDQKQAELEQKADFQALSESIMDVFSFSVQSGLDQSFARYALSRAAQIRHRNLLTQVLQSWDILAPVAGYVFSYLKAIYPFLISSGSISPVLERMNSSSISRLEFFQRWALDFATSCLSKDPPEAVAALLLKYVEEHQSADRGVSFVRTKEITQDRVYIGSFREEMRSQVPEMKRALIMASKVLSPSERSSFLDGCVDPGDTLEKALKDYAKS